MKMEITIWSADRDEEMTLRIPAKYEVCHRCEGRGTHVNPSIDGNGLTASDFADDPDFAEDYFGGRYDVRCYECNGKRVTLVPDESKFRLSHRLAFRIWETQVEEDARYESEERYLRRMESGYY